MSDRISYVRLFFDDFEGGIIQLNSHERGVYFTLCLRYWATKRCLYDDDRTLARACNCSVQAYKKAKAKLIDMGKIAVVDGKLYQPRADAEYEDVLEEHIHAQSVERARARSLEKARKARWENHTPVGRAWLHPHTRAAVLERDGYRCVYCGDGDGPFHIDHVLPVSRGGSDDLENLTCACAACNLSKSNKTPDEWRATQDV